VFPVFGLALLTATLVVLAVWAQAMSATALGWLLLGTGLFMGTVMGVVQVTVQYAAGSARLGEAAASVQFSRSIGAAFGTALVTAILFAVLSLKSPEAARLFAAMTEHGARVSSDLPAAQQAEVRTVIAEAFRIAFLSIAAFTTAGFFLALSIPLRRI
jgi:heme/copper-type cytochrome/quinol oxidase subunit 2